MLFGTYPPTNTPYMNCVKNQIKIILFCLVSGFSANAALHTTGFAVYKHLPAFKTTGAREVDFKIVYKLSVKKPVSSLLIKMIVPNDLKDRQQISKLSFSTRPDSIYTANSSRFAIFRLNNLEKDMKIVVKGRAIIYNSIKKENEVDTLDFSKYLAAEENIETGSKSIQELAMTLKQKTDIETVIKTFEYVSSNIRYEIKDAIGAEKVLALGVGKCMDYSDLFVALLRANHIPAKSVFGMLVDEVGKNPLHAWPEAYLGKQGWVRFDPTTGNSEIVMNGKNYLMRISNSYLTLFEGRNDPELRTSMIGCYTKQSESENFTIDISFDLAAQ